MIFGLVVWFIEEVCLVLVSGLKLMMDCLYLIDMKGWFSWFCGGLVCFG